MRAQESPGAPAGTGRRRVVLVEDEPDIAEAIGYQLQKVGLEVRVARTGEEGLHAVRAGADLVLLDLNLPGMDGLEVCRMIRRQATTAHLPIIIVSARADEVDRVLGLEMGADDYVVKPFSPKELLARVRALFRRLERKDETDDVSTIGALEMDRARHLVRCAGKRVYLTAKEFALLLALVDARGRVLSRDTLLQDVWGYSYTAGTRTVDVHVRRLREKMPAFAGSIVTVKSLGYRIPRDGE